MSAGGDPEVEELVREIRATVAERRAAGAVPPGLEEQLDRHRRWVEQRQGDPLDAVAQRLADLRAAPVLSAVHTPTASRRPGGSLVHRLVGRLVRRQVEGALQQVQARADRMLAVLEAQQGAMDDLRARLDHVLERLAALERASGGGQEPPGDGR